MFFDSKWLLALLVVILLLLTALWRTLKKAEGVHQLALKWSQLFILGAFGLFSCINILTYQHQFQTGSQQLEQELVLQAQQQVQQRALFVHSLLEHEKNKTERRLDEKLEAVVQQAISTASHLVSHYQNSHTPEQLTELVIEALRHSRHSQQRGYLFATRLDGTELLFADHPELEGQNLLDFQDQDGNYYIQQMIELIRQHGQGFINYRISKPGSPSWDHLKRAYIQYFPALDCLIGSGDYLEDFEQEIQRSVLETLEALSSSGALTHFAASYDGLSLLGPGKGTNVLDVQDAQGRFIVRQMIKNARSGGGFLRYQMPTQLGSENYEKISYCLPVAGWNWYVGAGINLDSVSRHIDHTKMVMQQNVRQQLVQATLFILAISFLLWLLARRICARIELNVQRLQQALHAAATDNQLVDLEQISLDEFAAIGKAANTMLSQRLDTEYTLQRSEARFRTALERAPLLVALLDNRKNIVFTNSMWQQMLGEDTTLFSEQHLLGIVNADQYRQLDGAIEDLLTRKTSSANLDLTLNAHGSGCAELDVALISIVDSAQNTTSVLIMAKNITARRTVEKRLQWMAHFDPLTGLTNRYHAMEQLERLRRQPESAQNLWLLMIDLNRFKHINDAYGQETGDLVLQTTARRLEALSPAPLLTARLSSDEFILVSQHVTRQAPEHMLRHLQQAIAQPMVFGPLSLQVDSCIGAVLFADKRVNELIQQAGIATQHAKENRTLAGIEIYSEQLDRAIQEEQKIENALREALHSPQQFQLHFQPIWDLGKRRLIGFEALIRWQHPLLGAISPAQFIPLAEKKALIIPLGKIVFELACQTLAHWQQNHALQGDDTLRISVNMAPQQFITDTFLEDIQETLQRHNVAPQRICIEVTETSLMENPELAIERIQSLKALGIILAIDDFGTGYSSLAYLNQFDVDTVKIDRSLVNTIAENNAVAKISEAIIRLAHDLQLKVVAEGVETMEQLLYLQQLDCDFIQGFLVGKPATALQAEEYLQQRTLIFPLQAGEA